MTDWIRNQVVRRHWQEVLVSVAIVLGAWLAARIFLYVIDRHGRRWAGATASNLDDLMLDAIRRPVAGLIALVGVYVAIGRYRFPLRSFVDGATFVSGVVLVVYTIIRVLGVTLRWYGERVRVERGAEGLAREVLPLVDKVGKVLLAAIGLAVILDHFRIEIRSILVTLGVGSLAIGLALQDTLANMFGGFTIMLDRPFRVGDRIQLSSGELGDVLTIGIRSTRIQTLERNVLVVPNAHLVKTLLTNQSFPDDRLRVMVEVKIARDADPDRAKALMVEIASAHPQVLDEPAPEAFLAGIADSAFEIVLVCHIPDFRGAPAVKDALYSGIRASFAAHGVEIATPTRTIRVRDGNRIS